MVTEAPSKVSDEHMPWSEGLRLIKGSPEQAELGESHLSETVLRVIELYVKPVSSGSEFVLAVNKNFSGALH